MSSYKQGYDEERFVTTVSQNFLCLICLNVLRDPVECPRNQHCFCRSCISKHLESSQRCPTCADKLTVETLTEPHRMVKDYLNELNIHCQYVNRGCQEIVQLQHLDRHEATCGFTPVKCKNQGCAATVNRRDRTHHETELCEFRKLKCHSCGETAKTLAGLEKRMANVEKNMAKNQAVMEAKLVNMEKNMLKNIERNLQRNMADIKTDMEGKFTTVNKEVNGLKAALVETFDEMKEVLVKMEAIKEEKARTVRPAPSGDKEYIIVAGGAETDSVQIFNWHLKSWSPLQSLPDKRHGATSFVYNNYLTIAGGNSPNFTSHNNMIRMNIDPNSDVPAHWSVCPFKLPARMAYHSSVLNDNQLIVTGGYNKNRNKTSDCIHEVQLVDPYTVKALSRMPEARREHCMEIFDDRLLIIGGRKTDRYQDNLSSVVQYDLTKNECKQLAPLPYEVSQMATVRWGDNFVVIGGVDKDGNALDKVVIYNVETEQHRMLPSMRDKRRACKAVVIGNNIVVLGGRVSKGKLKSVEAFNFDRYTWEELPEMCDGRYLPTAVVV